MDRRTHCDLLDGGALSLEDVGSNRGNQAARNQQPRSNAMSATFLFAAPLLVHLARTSTIQVPASTPPPVSTTALLGDSQSAGSLGAWIEVYDTTQAVTTYAIAGSMAGPNQVGEATSHDQVALVLADGCPDNLVLSFGLNDLWQDVRSPQEVVDEMILAELEVLFACPDTLVFVNEISPVMGFFLGADTVITNAKVDSCNLLLRQAFAGWLIETHDAVDDPVYFIVDGIHLNSLGLTSWASAIAEALP